MMKFDPRLPTTPGIRAPRYGESILSVNGSPLQVPLAALANNNGGGNGGTYDPSVCWVSWMDGCVCVIDRMW